MGKVEEKQSAYLYWFIYNLFGCNSQGHRTTVITCVVTVVVVQRTCRGGTAIGRIHIYMRYADSCPAEPPGRPYIDSIIYLLYIITKVKNNNKFHISHLYFTSIYNTYLLYMSYISPFSFTYIFMYK